MGAGNTFIWLGLVPALRFEQPKLLGVTGIFRNQSAAQPTDTKNFDPLPSALVSPARTGGEKQIKFGKSQLLPCPKLFHKAAALTSCKSNC